MKKFITLELIDVSCILCALHYYKNDYFEDIYNQLHLEHIINKIEQSIFQALNES